MNIYNKEKLRPIKIFAGVIRQVVMPKPPVDFLSLSLKSSMRLNYLGKSAEAEAEVTAPEDEPVKASGGSVVPAAGAESSHPEGLSLNYEVRNLTLFFI